MGRLTWLPTTIAAIRPETARARTLELDVPAWPGHRPGQHVDLRLTADDGYQAVRSYSLASPPEWPRLEVTVEQVDDGEVSPYLVEEARPGDQLELRGPIGGYFVWTAADGGPLLLVAGGSGLAPLMAMLRHREAQASAIPTRVLVSARSLDDLLYAKELAVGDAAGLDVHITLTRDAPAGWTGSRGRVDRDLLAERAWSPDEQPRTYVCGPTGFVEAVAGDLVELGHPPPSIRTERFGPTGA